MNFELETIIIDAGHGGKDPGAVNRWGVQEKDVVLAVATQLRDYLAKQAPAHKVVMIRDSDVFVELEDRAWTANEVTSRETAHAAAAQSDSIFVSIHCNSAANTSARGAEVFVYNIEATGRRATRALARENLGEDFSLDFIFADMRKRATAPYTERLAHHIDLHLSKVSGVDDSSVEGGPFYVLFYTAMPAVLIELGFLTNAEEQKALTSPAHQRRLVAAIGDAILAFGDEMSGPDEQFWTAADHVEGSGK